MLAKVDLFQSSTSVREAIEAFENGNPAKALTFLEEKTLDEYWVKADNSKERDSRTKEQAIENYIVKAYLLAANTQNEQAYQKFNRAIDLDSSHVNNLWELADFYWEANDVEKTIDFYKRAIRNSKDGLSKSVLLLNLGKLLADNGENEIAEEAYLSALPILHRLVKNHQAYLEIYLSDIKNNLGNLYADRAEFQKAEKTYLEAMEVRERYAQSDPGKYKGDLASTYNNLGTIYFEQGIFEKAEEAFRDALEIRNLLASTDREQQEPKIAMVQYNLALIYREQEAFDQAIIAFSAALEIYERLMEVRPAIYAAEVAGIHKALVSQYMFIGENDHALDHCDSSLSIHRKLIPLEPEFHELETAWVLLLKGMALIQKEQTSEAFLAFSEAEMRAAKYPSSPALETIKEIFGQYFIEVEWEKDKKKK